MDNKNDVFKDLIELGKYYEVIAEFTEKYNNISYVEFDYHVVHNFTLFLVDPDFDFEKLNEDINRIMKALPPIKRIFSKPVLHLAEKNEILPIETVTKISNDTINHIARHSEFWDDVTAEGIRPTKLLTRMYYDNYGIYENLVFCKAIDDILQFVRKNIRILKNFNYVNQSIEFDLLQRVNHLNYFLALGKLHTGYIRNYDKYYVVSKQCLKELELIYNAISSRLKKPVYSKNKARPKKIKKTNILAMHRDYKHIYSIEKYFIKNKQEVSYEFDKENYQRLKENYISYITLLSIFSIGHFNFKCEDESLINYDEIDIDFTYKDWRLYLRHCYSKNLKLIEISVIKDKEYKIVLIPIILSELKEETIEKVKKSCKADEYIACFPFEQDEYELDECCIDISNLESFRRLQQIVLRAMIYSDVKREECPFCNYKLKNVSKNDLAIYECDGCRTLIYDSVCDNTGKRYSYTDINGYEKEELDSSSYLHEKWMYYRKKEAILHFRNITMLDNEFNSICPKCKKVHK